MSQHLTDKDIKEYVDLCIFLGGFQELIQGSGGNISVKSDHELAIKSSGRVLGETTTSSGYVICDKHALQETFEHKQEDVKHTVITECKGDIDGIPSMEVFFHLLPFKWVVHLHPVYLLSELCQTNWRSYFESYNSSLLIPYKTPGLELSTAIHSLYGGERILFLQNHGIILCGDTIEEILKTLDIFYNKTRDSFYELYQFQSHMREKTGQALVLKHCSHIPTLHERYFMPITPDISLFLKQYPLAKETQGHSLESMFDEYMSAIQTYPTVIRTLHGVYALGKSYSQCGHIEEVLESYLALLRSTNPNTLHYFTANSISSLQTSEKEVYRMNIV
jgi:rhamnose utilization protein RhaD (predicted bifunctional aldolase and dehydrogenase)